jgi:hypothetical protein
MISALVVHPSFVCRRAGDAASRHLTVVGARDSRDERPTAATRAACRTSARHRPRKATQNAADVVKPRHPADGGGVGGGRS